MPDDGGVAPECLARIDFDASARADDDDPAVAREDAEVLVQIDVRGHLEDEVDTASVGCAHDGVEIVGVAVVDGEVHALFAQQLQALVGAAAAEDAHAVRARQLDGGDRRRRPSRRAPARFRPRARCARMNSERYAVTYGTPIAAPCAKLMRAGQSMQHRWTADRVLGVGARTEQRDVVAGDVHAVAGTEALDVGARRSRPRRRRRRPACTAASGFRA